MPSRRGPATLSAAAETGRVPGAGPDGRVRVVFTKWGDRPHWEYDAVRLGEDEHGVWIGAGAGTRLSRPGASFESPQRFVTLVPHEEPFVATFYDAWRSDGAPSDVVVYVDITTVPRWDGDLVSMVDLDLDVLRGRTGRVWIDDEDEFAAHRVRYGYPTELVRLAAGSCDRVHADVTAERTPYDGVADAWLSRLSGPPDA